MEASKSPGSTIICSCSHHTIDPGGDPYAAHREWITLTAGREQFCSMTEHYPGIGVSRPEPEVLVQIQHEDAEGV